MNSDADTTCHLCGGTLSRFAGFSERARVTSDCRPWPVGGALAVCTACNTVQKPVDAAWHVDAQAIYQAYAIYDQGDGAEQMVFDAAGGSPRSTRIAEACSALLPDGDFDALDIGCGNGAFLRALSARFPRARLSGTEFDARNRTTVLTIPGVVAFHAGDFEAVDGRYDLISIIHVLEHIVDPAAFLRTAAHRLKPNGRILIEVPDRGTNFFDLLIADHCTHFDRASLERCCRDAGLDLVLQSTAIVPKELTFVARAADDDETSSNASAGAEEITIAQAAEQIAWLARVAEQACSSALLPGPFGIFGTSIAATWLDTELQGRAEFFVDEDPSRIGRAWFNRPILGPQDVAKGARVFVPLVPEVAQRIADRLHGVASYEIPEPPFG